MDLKLAILQIMLLLILPLTWKQKYQNTLFKPIERKYVLTHKNSCMPTDIERNLPIYYFQNTFKFVKTKADLCHQYSLYIFVSAIGTLVYCSGIVIEVSFIILFIDNKSIVDVF